MPKLFAEIFSSHLYGKEKPTTASNNLCVGQSQELAESTRTWLLLIRYSCSVAKPVPDPVGCEPFLPDPDPDPNYHFKKLQTQLLHIVFTSNQAV